jgi:putative membrane protein insertion efficiency factor
MLEKILIKLIKFYQNHRPHRCLGLCIYEPSCSQYALIAIERHGATKGIDLAIRRILRCNKKSDGGYDAVP